MLESEAIALRKDRYSLSREQLWELREYFQRMQCEGFVYPPEYYGDWMQDIDDVLRDRGFLVDGEAKVIPPRALPLPRK